MAEIKLYDHIDILTMDRFIDCVCDQRYTVLIIQGTPTEEQLHECWEGVWYQYIDANQDNETLYILQLKKEISLLDYRINLIEKIVSMLMNKAFFNANLLASLGKMGVRVAGIDPEKSDYELRLKKILGFLAPRKLALKDKVKEYELYQAALGDGKVDRQVFKIMLSRVSKYQGYPMRPKETMVSEYVAALSDYLLVSSKKQQEDGKEG